MALLQILPPGGNATLLLIVINTVAFSYTQALSSNSLRIRASAAGIVAFPFWIWAVRKWVSLKRPDLGAISFLLVMIMTLYARRFPSSYSGRLLLFIACETVSVNYFFPIFVFDLPRTFNIYLLIGSIYWTAIGVWCFQVDIEKLKV